MPFSENTVFIAAQAGAGSGNPIAVRYESILLVMVFERDTGIIVDTEFNSVCGVTSRFVSELFVGRSIYTQHTEIAAEIRERYLGKSGNGLIFCLQDIVSQLRSRGMMPV